MTVVVAAAPLLAITPRGDHSTGRPRAGPAARMTAVLITAEIVN